MEATPAINNEADRVSRLFQWDLFQRGLLAVLVVLLVALPGVVLSKNFVTNEFLYQNVALVEWSMTTGEYGPHLGSVGSPTLTPAYNMILLELASMTALPPASVQFLPIGVLLLALTVFTLLRSFTGSSLIGILAVLYLAYDTSLGLSIYSVFAYSWNFPLYVVFIFAYLRWFVGLKAADLLVMVLAFGGAYFIHYTAPLWMILLVGVGYVLRTFLAKIGCGNRLHWPGISLTIAMVTFYLAFNGVLYQAILPRFSADVTGESDLIAVFIARIAAFFGASRLPGPYAFVAAETPALGILRGIQYLILIGAAISFGVWLAIKPQRLGRADAPATMIPALVLILSLVTLAVDIGGYSAAGRVSLKYIPFGFPLLLAIGLCRAENPSRMLKRVALAMAVTLALIGVLKFQETLTTSPDILEDNQYVYSAGAAGWVVENWNSPEPPRVLSDMHTVGKALVSASANQKPLRMVFYDPANYAALVEPDRDPRVIPADFVLINRAQAEAPVVGIYWQKFLPLAEHEDAIDSQAELHSPYDDGWTRVYMPAR